jgi:hypothetical protein
MLEYAGGLNAMAEGVGFEPTLACAKTVFKTVTIVHSVTPPEAYFEAIFTLLCIS